MTRMIEVGDKPFALLVETDHGDYLVPPVVFDLERNVIEGREVLEAIIESGMEVSVPVLHNRTTADLAAIDQTMKLISDQLGVPIGPPGA